MRRLLFIVLAACSATPSSAQTFPSSTGNLSVETVARGLANPWALAFLPDGKMLVTEKPGRMRIVTRDGKVSPPVANVPQVRASGQGGLHDVVLDRDFASNKTIYFCYAEPASGGGRTSMARARLSDGEAPSARRREGDLPPGRAAVERQPLWMPHRAGARRQSLAHDGRPLRLSQRRAKPRQPHRQDRARHAGRRGAAGQSVRRPQRREAGDLELRPPQLAGRRAASADRQALDARARPARAATRSTFRSRARTTAGR